MRHIEQNLKQKQGQNSAWFNKGVLLILSFFILSGLRGQTDLFEVNTNYTNCDSVGSISILVRDTTLKVHYKILSNDCGFPLRPDQAAGIFLNLKPCQYTIGVVDDQGSLIYSKTVKLGFSIVDHFTFKCNNSFATLSQITVTGGLAVAYSIDFLPQFRLGRPDTVFNLPTLDYISIHELTVYDACGHTDKVKLNHIGKIDKQVLCDDSQLFAIPVAKTTYNPFFLNDTLTFKWTLNGNPISQENFVKLTSYVPGNKLVFEANSSYCKIKDSVTLQNEPSRKINLMVAADRQILCNQDSLLLKANVTTILPVKYSWSTKDTNDEISIRTEGIYQVIAITDEGCSDTAEIFIRRSSIALTSQTTSNLCFGEAKGSIDLDVNGGIAPISYIWSDSIKSADRLNLANGSYKVVVLDSVGCQVSDSFMITSPTPMSLTLSAHAADCIPAHNGKVTTMMEGGVPPYRYQWSNGLTVPNVDTLSPGSYTITIFDQNQCSVFFPFRIDDLNPLLGFRRDTICANSTLQVGQSVYNMTGRYVDSLKSFKGCDSVVTTFLIVNNPVDFDFNKKDPTCNGLQDGSLSITAVSGLTDYKIFLNDQLYSPAQLQSIPSGNYVIKLQDYLGCFKEKGFALSNPPLIDFSLGGDRTVTYGDTLSVIPTTNLNPSSIKQITWQTTPLQPNCIFCDAIYKYKPVDDHILKATIESITGCKVSNQINISLDKDFKVFVPNIFTPKSGGFAENQYLTIYGGSQVEKINYWRIFNRYGDLVYEAKDFLPNGHSYTWDGTIKGAESEQGVYVYVASVTFADGSIKVIKGDVTLAR